MSTTPTPPAPPAEQPRPLEELIRPEEYYFSAPRIAGPLERRAAFRVIKGGKS